MKFLICLFLLFVSCQKKDDVLPTKSEIVNQVRRNVAKQLKCELGLHPIGTGAQMMYKVEMLSLSFKYYQSVDMEMARTILIQATDKFVRAINIESKIHPYLGHYPFSVQDVQVWVFFEDDKKPNSMSSMRITNGMLFYSVTDPINPMLEIKYEETYEEAVQKLRQNSQASKAA